LSTTPQTHRTLSMPPHTDLPAAAVHTARESQDGGG
jgi:hypothetical protein